MTVRFACGNCGRTLKASGRFAGSRGTCPTCRSPIDIPVPGARVPQAAVQETGTVSMAGSQPSHVAPDPPPSAVDADMDDIILAEVVEYLDPPSPLQQAEETTPAKSQVMRRMFEALLDPRSIQWMLMLGGGLAVLGLVIWVVSLGFFENRVVVAVSIGVGTLLVLGTGWLVTLKTRYKTAGQALTFLGCVLAPLNLWYYHVQDLVTLDNHLWVGGVLCCLLYVATVRVLRNPLFMYAVEVGVTLTVTLLLADLPLELGAKTIAICFMAMGLISIHLERAFAAGDGEFSRERYGMPLFWSGHVQLAIALICMVWMQFIGILHENVEENRLLLTGLWLVAAYAYLYSDLVVRRVGVYVYLAALSLLIAVLTFVVGYLNMEVAILALAVTALAANVFQRASTVDERFARIVGPLGVLLSGVPLLLGWSLHLRATSSIANQLNWQSSTSVGFFGIMLGVAVCNRISAWLYRGSAPKRTVVYLFFSAAALLIAAAGLLRVLGLESWSQQAPLLMLVPIAYLIAARLWRGQLEEKPLSQVAQIGTAIILAHALVATVSWSAFFSPAQGQVENLLFGVVFLEAALFYGLASVFCRTGYSGYLSAAAVCAAMWQFLGYFEVAPYLHAALFAILGTGLLVLARVLKIEQVEIYRPSGRPATVIRGRGLGVFQSGSAILSIAFLAALLQGLSELAGSQIGWQQLFSILLTAAACGTAIVLVPGGAWRRVFGVYAISLAALAFLTLNVLIDLSGWQKLEIFCTVAGIVLIVAGYVGRFQEPEGKRNDMIGLMLWGGSLLATLPVVVAVVYFRFSVGGMSLVDEFALLTIALLMLVTGYSWQTKSTTLLGGTSLVFYLGILIVSLAYQRQVSQGMYLAIGGITIFALGVLLSVYRDKLLALPDRIAQREGIFKIINWR